MGAPMIYLSHAFYVDNHLKNQSSPVVHIISVKNVSWNMSKPIIERVAVAVAAHLRPRRHHARFVKRIRMVFSIIPPSCIRKRNDWGVLRGKSLLPRVLVGRQNEEWINESIVTSILCRHGTARHGTARHGRVGWLVVHLTSLWAIRVHQSRFFLKLNIYSYATNKGTLKLRQLEWINLVHA